MKSDPRVLIATPVYGRPETATVHVGYMMAVQQLAEVAMVAPAALVNCDLVRARSRAVRYALDGCYTHLLFWDSDIGGDCGRILLQMLSQDVDFIAAPYARKNDGEGAAHGEGYVPMGFTLLSQACLERMWDGYYDELQFDDIMDNKPFRTVAMFQLLMVSRNKPRSHRVLLSEDYSFCERWMRLDGDVHLYTGPGALTHFGGHAYRVRVGGP